LHKPDPFPLHYAAGLLGVPLEDCAYIGDSPHDMTAAIAGGAVSVAALWGAFEPKDVLEPGPDYALPSIGDLEEWLKGDSEHYRVTASARVQPETDQDGAIPPQG
jgi:pyrophosphatase PpaX